MATKKPIAIVTGGTRGIGSGIAEVLAEAGYDLLLTYNTDQEAAQSFAKTLSKKIEDGDGEQKIKVECVGGDISLFSTRDKIFECLDCMIGKGDDAAASSSSGPLAVLVHNAGQYVGITSDNADNLSKGSLVFGDGSLVGDDGRTNFDIMHYYQRMYGEAFVDLCERFLIRMKNQSAEGGRGSIVGISSPGVTAHYYGPNVGYSMPGSGKCVMEYTMRIYAAQAAKHGINVNVLVPGVTNTPAWNRIGKDRGMSDGDQIMKGILHRRAAIKELIQPRDIGEVVKFLSSPSGKFVTGTVVPVDGGLHMGI